MSTACRVGKAGSCEAGDGNGWADVSASAASRELSFGCERTSLRVTNTTHNALTTAFYQCHTDSILLT